MRWTEEKAPDNLVDENGKLAPSPNTYIIAPSVWYGCAVIPKLPEEPSGKKRERNGSGVGIEPATAPRVGNFYEILLSEGELSVDALSDEMRGMINVSSSLVCEL